MQHAPPVTSTDFSECQAPHGHRLGLHSRITRLPRNHRKQDGQSGVGPAYDLEGSLSCSLGRWRLAVGGGRRQSRRETTYTSNRATARVGVDF